MEVIFKEPWLIIGDEAGISLDGRVLNGGIEKKVVRNLGVALFEFLDRLLEESKLEKFEMVSCFGYNVPRLCFEGKYKTVFIVPCKISFQGSGVEGVISFHGISKRYITSYFELKFGKVSYFEPGENEFVANKMIELASRHRLGLPLYVLDAKIENDTLVFYAPDGNWVFKLNDEDYELNYHTFYGLTKKSKTVLKWFEWAIVKSFKERLDSWRIDGNALKARSGNFDVFYDLEKRELVGFTLAIKELWIEMVSMNRMIKISELKGKRIESCVWANLQRFCGTVGMKLWDLFKFLSF